MEINLQEVIEENIVNDLRHEYYNHVTQLAKKYEAFVVNPTDSEGNSALSEYLRQFVRREDEDLFEQRKNLTKFHTTAIASQIMRVFNKVIRSNRVIKMIETKEDQSKPLVDALSNFYGQTESNGVDQFLEERFLPLTFTDPNAWFLISFDEFDGNVEKPQPFPLEYSSEDVTNFHIKNDITHWVIVKLKHTYKDDKDKDKQAERWLIYGENQAYEYKEIPDDMKNKPEDTPGAQTQYFETEKKKKYLITEYNHKSERVPLIRVGYRKDIETQSKTFVNPFHYEGMPLLEQFIKVSSELQLSITLHAFPKQVMYVEPCEAEGCSNGELSDGSTCQACEGSGKKVHTTSADILEIPTPRRGEEYIDVNKLSTYIPFPGGVMEFLDKYADKLEKKIIRMMFNSESLVQTQFNTATEAEIDVDSVYDTLSPFASKYSEIWVFFVALTKLYISVEKGVTFHKFPRDFKLKPLNQLLKDLELANKSGAPSYIRESINKDIADIIYADDPDERGRLAIKNRHFPFAGKTELEIQNIILNNLCTRESAVLYANFDNIFDALEVEDEKFYDKAYEKQKEAVANKVSEIILNIGAQALDLT